MVAFGRTSPEKLTKESPKMRDFSPSDFSHLVPSCLITFLSIVLMELPISLTGGPSELEDNSRVVG